ncbi:hypothetical protein LTR84_010198 [Exophiala bonariae]|uniref:Enoyl reductase (ER) domain-containing protein n=1 Tax=Exophiala bonariae TaxID=1690606 RepID=A0AAV9MUA5_9EURO|nr:hypothetical protein LTR84_010198 [Exophiala bonariae]
MSSTMKAVVIRGKEAKLERDRALPKLRDDYILVKTEAVALNPTDWKHVAFGLGAEGGLVGCDFAGTVIEVGNAVTKGWKKGDRLAGVNHGGNSSNVEDGAFAEYVVSKGDLQIKIPDGLSFEDASTLTLGVTTVQQGLYQKALKLNLPNDPIKEKTFVLIYGGSTATGALGVQFAKLSGYTVLATSSPRNFDYVKSLGATEVFDYNEPNIGQKIREYTQNKLKLAWDTVSESESATIVAQAMSTESGGRYGSILPNKFPRDDVKHESTLMYTIFGEAFRFGPTEFPPVPEDFEYTKTFLGIVEKLLADGKLKPHSAQVGKDGLEGVLKGLDDLKNGNVSGQKLVYRVSETP